MIKLLNIIKITKEKYEKLSEKDKSKSESLFLCKDTNSGLCSIYVDGDCYGEDIDEENINDEIQKIKNDLYSINIATNADILAILNS